MKKTQQIKVKTTIKAGGVMRRKLEGETDSD